MWDNSSGVRVYLSVGSTDMRKQINGLSIQVEQTMELDPFSGSVFVFCNRRRSIVKALYWDRNGFCLWQKRLGRDRFRWPETAEEVMTISPWQHGEEVTEELDIVPRQSRVIRHIRPKYACRQCEGVESDKGAVQIAPPPVQLLPKTIATAGLIAAVVVEKFADGLPLYRQAARFSREGIEISRATLSNWVVRVGELCSPLMKIFREDLRTGALINADETPVQVLNEPGRANTRKSYMWVFRGGMSPPDRGGGSVVIFDYRPTRSGEEILKEYLRGYTGYVQTDGYVGYEVLSELSVTHAGCWAHVRRKFVEVVQAVDKARKGKERRGGSADEAIMKIRRLYEIERKGKELELKGIDLVQFRREHALPLLKEFHDWLIARVGSTPPKGLLGTAMNYALKQWDRLVVYADDPHVGLDNNAAENAIRPFAEAGRTGCLQARRLALGQVQPYTAWWRRQKPTGLSPIDICGSCLSSCRMQRRRRITANSRRHT